MSLYNDCAKLWDEGHSVAAAVDLHSDIEQAEIFTLYRKWQGARKRREFLSYRLTGHPDEKKRMLNLALVEAGLTGRRNLWIHEAFRGGKTPDEGGALTKLYEPLTAGGGRLTSHFFKSPATGHVLKTMPRDVAALNVRRANDKNPQLGYNLLCIDPFGCMTGAYAILGGAFQLFAGTKSLLFMTYVVGGAHARVKANAEFCERVYGSAAPDLPAQLEFVARQAKIAGRTARMTDFIKMSRNTFRAAYVVEAAKLPVINIHDAVRKFAETVGA